MCRTPGYTAIYAVKTDVPGALTSQWAYPHTHTPTPTHTDTRAPQEQITICIKKQAKHFTNECMENNGASQYIHIHIQPAMMTTAVTSYC